MNNKSQVLIVADFAETMDDYLQNLGSDEYDLTAVLSLEEAITTYIHGGLTPEETLIPMALFTPQTVSSKPLTLRLLNNEFYYARKSEVRLDLDDLL